MTRESRAQERARTRQQNAIETQIPRQKGPAPKSAERGTGTPPRRTGPASSSHTATADLDPDAAFRRLSEIGPAAARAGSTPWAPAKYASQMHRHPRRQSQNKWSTAERAAPARDN